MNGFFAKLFGSKENGDDGWTQPQREALIDLLVFAMYIDNHLSLAEERVLDEQKESLAWAGDRSVEAYVDHATSRIRELRGSEEGRANLLDYIRERLGDFEERERAWFVCESLLSADGRPEVEALFTDRCKQALQV